MRRYAFAFVAATMLVAALVQCAILAGIDDVGYRGEHGVAEAAVVVDASAPSAEASSGDAYLGSEVMQSESGASWCSLQDAHLLCEDFDTPDALASWQQVAVHGTVTLTLTASSPPLAAELHALDSGVGEQVITTISKGPGHADGGRMRVAFDARLATSRSTGLLDFALQGTTPDVYVLSANADNT
jgi:hypothetical protein